MPYLLDYTPTASKAIAGLPHSMQQRVFEKVERLADNPRPAGSVKLSGSANYRIRVGDYRIVYGIQDDRLIISIVDVGHRREVYRRK